jgi:hypothetical protein
MSRCGLDTDALKVADEARQQPIVSRRLRRQLESGVKEVDKVSEDPMTRLLELDLEYLHRTIDKFDNQGFL